MVASGRGQSWNSLCPEYCGQLCQFKILVHFGYEETSQVNYLTIKEKDLYDYLQCVACNNLQDNINREKDA